MSASTNFSDSQTTNNTQDRRLTTGEGDVFGFSDGGGITVQTGGSLNISRNDPAVAKAAFDAAQGLASSSNAIASKVAATPVDTAAVLTGQKSFMWIAVAIVIGAILIFRRK
jgi:hypothetical protein